MKWKEWTTRSVLLWMLNVHTLRYETIRYTEDDNNDGVRFFFGFIFECSNPPIVAHAVYSVHTLDFIRMVKFTYSNLWTHIHTHSTHSPATNTSMFMFCWHICHWIYLFYLLVFVATATFYFFFLFIVVFYSIFRPIIYVAFVSPIEEGGENESD